MDEYIKAMQDKIRCLKSEVMFLRKEVKDKNVFIEQLNNNNNNNNIPVAVKFLGWSPGGIVESHG